MNCTNSFLGQSFKAMEIKAKNKQMASNQTSSFCIAMETKWKGNLQLNFKNSSYNSTKKPNNPIQNWAEDLNQRFSKDDIQMANKHMKRWSTLEKCRLKLRGTTLHQSEWLSLKSLQINSGEGVEKKEPSYTVYGNENWYRLYGK